jgi:hypothetical protein
MTTIAPYPPVLQTRDSSCTIICAPAGSSSLTVSQRIWLGLPRLPSHKALRKLSHGFVRQAGNPIPGSISGVGPGSGEEYFGGLAGCCGSDQ